MKDRHDIDRWPFVPAPYDDEILSSWIARIALAHFTDWASLFSQHWAYKNYHHRDVDCYKFTRGFWKTFSLKTGYPVKRIKQMSLKSYEGAVQEKIEPTGRQHMVIMGAFCFNRSKTAGTKFCPCCLKEEPYFKKEWRLLFVNVCNKHKIFLHNRCPRCGQSIIFWKQSPQNTVTQCWNCRFDLANTEIRHVNPRSYGLRAQEFLLKTAEKRWFLLNGKEEYSLGLFFSLRIIMLKLKHTGIDNDVFKTEIMLGNCDAEAFNGKRLLEELGTDNLFVLFGVAVWLLRGWPDRWREFCLANKLTNKPNILEKYRSKEKEFPYWFIKGVNSFVESIHPPTKKEIDAALQHLGNQGKFTLYDLAKLTGYKYGSAWRFKKMSK